MYQFHAELFVGLVHLVSIWNRNPVANGPLADASRTMWAKGVGQLVEPCQEVGLKVSAEHAARLARELEGNVALTDELFRQRLYSLTDVLTTELSGVLFIHIPFKQAGHFISPREKWEGIIDRFHDTLTDIEEAQKCLALSRYTAAVFHSLQIVEVGLIELGRFVGVNDPLSGWTAVAQRLKKIVEAKYQDLTEFERENRAFLAQTQGTVEGLKNAWRNKVSHAGQRLTLMTGEEFHPDVAEEILMATRAFMRRLVEGLPKPPQPTDV